MKGKTLIGLVTALSIVLALMPPMAMATTEYMEVLFQDTGTNTYIIASCVPPVNFKVDLKIHDVVDMWGWSTIVSWNPAVLNCTNAYFLPGPFNPIGTSVLGVVNNDVGTIPKLAASTTVEDSETGTGVVITLDFVAHSTGASLINITDTNYIDLTTKTKVYIDEVDGNFECQVYVGPPRPPVAEFTPVTCEQFNLDKDNLTVTVDFDACASEGSYDPLPDPGTENPIVEYRWDFDGDGEWDKISPNLKVTLWVNATLMLDLFSAECPDCEYFMGWSCGVRWDTSELEYAGIGYERGPYPDIAGVLVDTSPPADIIECLAFGALEEASLSDARINMTGKQAIAYLYFRDLTCGVGAEVTVENSTVSCYYYDEDVRIVCKTPYDPEFEATYTLEPTDWCTASWTYDETYPGEAIDAPVTLEVYAPDCNDTETHGDFEDTDNVTNTIHILPPSVGPDIDVYTERDGEGKGCDKTTGEEYGPVGDPPVWSAMSDAFGPQEAVTVCALVTYNDEPVENKLVAFEIRSPNGTVVAWRSASTNSDGIACVEFRIPWTGATAEDLFGAWLITATVDIAEETVMDKCRFRFGYLVTIIDIALDPTSLYKGEDLEATITLGNIAFTSKDVVLTIVLYDECGVPINQMGSPITVPPVETVAPPMTLSIPTWAFVGVGTAYVNVFDDWPHLGGTPMCPEDSETFVILNTP